MPSSGDSDMKEKIPSTHKINTGQDQTVEQLERQLEKQQELTRQYYRSLTELEETFQNRINAYETCMRQKENAIAKLQERLTEQWSNESIIEQLKARLKAMNEINRRRAEGLQELQRLFNALKHNSRRWKFGNAVGRMIEALTSQSRIKRPTVLDHIQSVIDQLEKLS